VVDTEALTFEQNAPDGHGAAPDARRALVFHDQVTVALALSRSLHLGDPGRPVDCFDDEFALVDAVGRDPAAVVLVGYRRGSTAAAEATALLLGLFPDACVIGFGGADCAPLLVAAVTGGVRGVMLWSPDGPVAGQHAAAGRRGLSTVDKPISPMTLTEREREVLSQIAEGWSNLDIGRAVSVSEEAVKSQVRSIYRKLRARDRAHAVALGIRLNYLT
jgi:DNA-binding NarL/FixJ family response regulator